jgi:ATP-dependent Clp protease protease subunit
MGGTASDITIQAENMLHVKRTMQELTAQHSGRTLDEIQRDWDRDRWFTAEQAREYGLIDQVITRAEQLPAV